MIRLKPDDKFLISLNLPFGESNRFIRCRIWNKDGIDVTPIPVPVLNHITEGLYMNDQSALVMPEGMYIVRAYPFMDSNFNTPDPEYGIAQETYLIRDEASGNVGDIDAKLAELNETIKTLKMPDIEVEFSVNENPNC